MVFRSIAAAILGFAAISAAQADPLLPELPVTTIIRPTETTFEVTNNTAYNLTVDFTLGVIQGEINHPVGISGGPFLDAKSIAAGITADYTYGINVLSLPYTLLFWFEASDLPGARDYQDVLRSDRDQWAAVIDNATLDPDTFLQVAVVPDRGGPLGGPLNELYPPSLNPGFHIFGAIASITVNAVNAIPEPRPIWIMLVGLFIMAPLARFERRRGR
jgi:hypothetical protein